MALLHEAEHKPACGNCWDAAPMERLFRSLKGEWISALGYSSNRDARKDIGKYLIIRTPTPREEGRSSEARLQA